MSLNNSKGKNPSKRESDKQFLADYTPPGGFPIYLDDSLAARIKFGAVLPLHPNSPGRVSQPQPSAIPSPEKPEDDRDVNMSVGSPPTSPTQSPIQYPVQSFDGNEPDRDVETSDWYSSELWTRQKVKEQEIKASKLIGDFDRIKATLEYYCANDLQLHSKWVRILADHILLLAESRGQYLNIAVAYHVSQLQASKYRQQLEASILESEAKRAYDEEMGKNKKGSMRGKSKIPRTDDASISKGTHPLSKKGSSRNSIPDDMMPTKGKKGDLNFRLVGPDDFLKTLKMSKATEADYFESFRQLRDDIFHMVPSDGQKTHMCTAIQRPLVEPIETIETKEALQDYDRMDTDIPKVPGYLDSNEECTIQ
ncbi:hypothetical protein TWF192_000998 [Orbilia oligospora]|uniref:Uncharacterized protein n=1 Tax=Orbilia oligospora TaxID=2813651 RepID=A0A6G1MHJ0_ORBOL|nr:hypothetical protein TWF191_005622 [Orbilia oligospora]KAF3257708.1 hypothetical protein TWF192_000998 [Orbilia oligospora]